MKNMVAMRRMGGGGIRVRRIRIRIRRCPKDSLTKLIGRAVMRAIMTLNCTMLIPLTWWDGSGSQISDNHLEYNKRV